MYEIIEKRRCTGCSACANICPVGCIEMITDEEGFYYPEIDNTKCISCGLCKKICYTKWTEQEQEYTVWALYNKDETARQRASSGGIFELLAREILKRNGVVFGVKMNDLEAVHVCVEEEQGLEAMLGSKYMQSKVENAYKSAKDFLDQGRKVLFSGTPCQIQALYKVIGRKDENLYTVDFICHGVSSPKVFKKYVFEELKMNEKIKKISFRDKTEGWANFSMYIETETGRKYRENMHNDIYLQSFLTNLNLRSSCFVCEYRTIKRVSDITLGDFWGCNTAYPEWNEDRGYSLAIVQSRHGNHIFQKIKKDIECRQIEIDEVLSHNQSIISSPWDELSRDLFFRYQERDSLKKSMIKAKREDLKKKVHRKWWKICRKIKSV